MFLKASQDKQCACCHSQCWRSFHRHDFWDSRQLITSGTSCGILYWMRSPWSLSVSAPLGPSGNFGALSCTASPLLYFSPCSALVSPSSNALLCYGFPSNTICLFPPAWHPSCCSEIDVALGSPGLGRRSPAGSSLWAPLNAQKKPGLILLCLISSWEASWETGMWSCKSAPSGLQTQKSCTDSKASQRL